MTRKLVRLTKKARKELRPSKARNPGARPGTLSQHTRPRGGNTAGCIACWGTMRERACSGRQPEQGHNTFHRALELHHFDPD